MWKKQKNLLTLRNAGVILDEQSAKMFDFQREIKKNKKSCWQWYIILIYLVGNLRKDCKDLWKLSKTSKPLKSGNKNKQTKNKFFWRVWSWLRMNAGGMPKTCKSYEVAQRSGVLARNGNGLLLSGGRVSNTWVICLRDWDNY